MLKRLNSRYRKNVKILQDLQGYRIRIGDFKSAASVALRPGQEVLLTNTGMQKERHVLPFDYAGPLSDLKIGGFIYIDDGNIALRIKSRTSNRIAAEVIVPGVVKPHKGINIPDLNLKFQGITEKDKMDLSFAVVNRVDFVAQSFVSGKEDMLCLREILRRNGAECGIIAKIENRSGIDNIDEILDVSDGIMIARGDLGVSLPIFEIPVLQKMIIRKCKQSGKFVITATQMLESMTEHLRPTRAEVSDVANAMIDGSDFLMLSGETAVGKHPVEAVEMMSEVIEFTARSLKTLRSYEPRLFGDRAKKRRRSARRPAKKTRKVRRGDE